MSFVGLKWHLNAGQDIHLLPGLASPRFNQLLSAMDQNPATDELEAKEPSEVPGLSLTFSAKFLGAPGPRHGVTLDPTTGEVTIASSLPPPGERLRSFLVTATATHGGITDKARVRVYVHSAITKMWLTPKNLTLRAEARNMRFTVLARFDNGVIGDISNWSPFQPLAPGGDFRHVHATGSNTPLLIWSSEGGTATVTADPVTGVLTTDHEAGTAMIKVSRGAQTATAEVRCAKPWTTSVRIKQVIAPHTPVDVVGTGVAHMHAVPNILFLPDGFQAADRGAFERLVRGAVARLSTRPRTRPFSHLRINYFMAWVPSPAAGASVLNELYSPSGYQVDDPNVALVLPVEPPSAVPPVTWELVDLIHEVGLATPVYDPPNSPIDDKVVEWSKVYGLHVTAGRMRHLYSEWLERGTRRLANEHDTAFHLAFGARPILDTERTPQVLTLHPRRLDPADFNAFLDALAGPVGWDQELPKVWSTGKDNNLVVFVSQGSRSAGNNSRRFPEDQDNKRGRMLAVTPHDIEFQITQAVVGDEFEVLTAVAPDTINYVMWLTIAHELAHSWTLGDEYGGDSSPPSTRRIQDTSTRANIQARDTLLEAGLLSGDSIRWGRWPRILKAGVLRATLEPVLNDRFRIPLESNKTAKFVVGDIVRLRTRPLPASIGHSGRFEVIDVSGDDVTITPLPGVVVDPALKDLFPPGGAGDPGSILMAPARAPDPNPAADQYGDDLMMVTDAVRQRINLTHNPLNAQPLLGEAPPPNDPSGRPGANVLLGVPTGAMNFPGRRAPNPPRFSSWTIGLYENGGTHNRGIYRPTGVCLMNFLSQQGPDKVRYMYEFCLVCRYAIVDMNDPTRHGRVNADYIERYERP